jgi:hypothetical protein
MIAPIATSQDYIDRILADEQYGPIYLNDSEAVRMAGGKPQASALLREMLRVGGALRPVIDVVMVGSPLMTKNGSTAQPVTSVGTPKPDADHNDDSGTSPPVENSKNTPRESGPTPSSWQRVDLGPILRGEVKYTLPTLLARTDDQFILYDHKLHWFSGPPESGKSWLALIACAEALKRGRKAFYIDFEGDAEEIVARLIALGSTTDQIERFFFYFRPHEPLTKKTGEEILHEAWLREPLVSTIDGVNDAMGASGFDFKDSTDFYRWWALLGEQLQAQTVGPTIALDHVTKEAAKTKSDPFASGTGQKLAKVDVHIGFRIREPFAPGRTGVADLYVLKDRPGRLRKIANDDRPQLLGRLVIESDEDESVTWSIEAPFDRGHDVDKEFRARQKMAAVFEFIGEHPLCSQAAIIEGVAGRSQDLILAVVLLAKEGFVVVNATGRKRQHSALPGKVYGLNE